MTSMGAALLAYPHTRALYQQEKRVNNGADQPLFLLSTVFPSSYYDYLYKSYLRGGELQEKSLTSREIRIKGRE